MEVNLYTRFLLFTLKEGREAGLSQRPLTQCSVHNLEYWSFPTGRYYSQNRLWGFCIQKYAEKTISLLLHTEAGWENNFTPFAYRSEQREQFHSFCIQKRAERTISLLLHTEACRKNNFTPAYRSMQREWFHSFFIQKHADRASSQVLYKTEEEEKLFWEFLLLLVQLTMPFSFLTHVQSINYSTFDLTLYNISMIFDNDVSTQA